MSEEWLVNPRAEKFTIKNENRNEIIVEESPEWFPWLEIKSGDILSIHGIDAFKFLDHVKFVKNTQYFPDRKDEVLVISEPYDLGISEINGLIKFCDIFSIEFLISGNSSHNPGACLRITFHRK